MNLAHLTNDDLQELRREMQRRGMLSEAWAWQPGDQILVRTVTVYALGRVREVGPSWIVLDAASWVATVGRFGVAVREGKLQTGAEVEHLGDGLVVERAAIVDSMPWRGALPTGDV